MRQLETHIEVVLNGYILTIVDDGEERVFVKTSLDEVIETLRVWYEDFAFTPTVAEKMPRMPDPVNAVFLQKDYDLKHTCRFCGFEVHPAIDPACGDWIPKTNPNTWDACPKCHGIPHVRGCRCASCIEDYGQP